MLIIAGGLGLIAVGGGAAAGLAYTQDRAGRGTWDQADVRDFIGELFTDPYPALRVVAQQELDGTARPVDIQPTPALLGCLGKCGVRPRLDGMIAGGRALVAIRGTLIQRDRHAMISVVDGPGWVRAVEAERDLTAMMDDFMQAVRRTFTGGETDLGAAMLTGEILDTKCWFGAMRPSEGKEHKACAALCIKSGLPPAFYAKDADGRMHAFLITDPEGGPLHAEVADFAADPVRVRGRLVQRDFVEFRIDPADIVRV